MNIFYIENNPKICAEMHVDRHVCKMAIEYAQLLCTAHRVLDGTEYKRLSANNRSIKAWRLPDEREERMMKPTMMNHPSAIWVRHSDKNYLWLYSLWCELLKEFTYRYGKTHACARLIPDLAVLPTNIPVAEFTEPTPAMPDSCKVSGDSIQSYRNYYLMEKQHLWSWSGKINKREMPVWLNQACENISYGYN